MKIAHICPFVGERMGGSERYVSKISKMQSKENEVHIYTTTRHLDRTGISQENGVTYHRFYSPIIIWNINPISFIVRHLADADMDVFHVHSYLYSTSNQAILAKLMKKKRALLQVHGGIGVPPYQTTFVRKWVKQIYDKSLGKFTIENSDLIASVSKSDLNKLSSMYNISNDKLCYVPNAVDINQFSFSAQTNGSKKTILFVGDLEKWKGVEFLIQWMSEKKSWDGHSFKIKFVGQGSLYSSLLKLRNNFQKNGSPIELELLGQRKHSEIPSLLKSADALILPSFWEGMPTVVLEAMASGTPVISTRVGDIPAIIDHLKSGILIDRTYSSFQAALSFILNDSGTLKKMARNGRRLIEKEFTYANVLPRLQKIYNRLIE